ncbi:MAG TPA: TIM44-like domain-containing protein [Coriobacteriia bacterium]
MTGFKDRDDLPFFEKVLTSVTVRVLRDGQWVTLSSNDADGTAPGQEKHGFELIRQTDPGFDEQDFRDRVAWMFVKVHHAITDQDLSRIRDFTDDRARLSLQRQIDSLASEGHVSLLKNLQIEQMYPLSVQQDGPVQRIVIHIVASGSPSVVERASGRLVLPETNGDGIVRRRFTESWILQRQSGDASAPPRPPLHRCPFCGGPVQENKRYVCTYCGTDLRGPEREWTILSVEKG